MERDTWWISGAFLVVVVAYAALSTVWVSADPGWYDRLAKPSFQPPDLVFGLIWPLNFLVLGIVGWQLGRTQPSGPSLAALGVFALSVCFALGWAYLFYVPHALGAAAACLAVAAVLTWVLVALSWRVEPWFGIALLVYAGWLTVATALAAAYARGN